jgi:hypothetical protein
MLSYLKDTNAVEVYDGANWVASDDPNAIQNTIVDAKGDLISATGSDVPARLAVGNNGETLVANSAATTGLSYKEDYAAGKNKIINGDFGIWQRGISFSNPASNSYTADRWSVEQDGTGATRTVSQQTFTPASAPVSGYEGQYFYRYAVSVAGSGNTFNDFNQRIEDVRTFAGQVVTLSFWAKAGANLSLETLSRQSFGSGGSSATQASIGSVSVTTAWQRFTQTYTVGSVSGKTLGAGSYLQIRFRPPANSTFEVDIWGVQIEAGSVATAFQTATGTLQGEIALCQRYYQRFGGDVNFGEIGGTGVATSTTVAKLTLPLKVTMRTNPTSIDGQANTLVLRVVADASASGGTWANNGSSRHSAAFTYTHGSGVFTSGDFVKLLSDGSNIGYVAFSAEL